LLNVVILGEFAKIGRILKSRMPDSFSGACQNMSFYALPRKNNILFFPEGVLIIVISFILKELWLLINHIFMTTVLRLPLLSLFADFTGCPAHVSWCTLWLSF